MRRRSPRTGHCAAALLLWLAGIAGAAPASAADYTAGMRYDALHRLTGAIEADPDDIGPLRFPAVRYTWTDDGQLALVEKGILENWQSETVVPSAWGGFTVQEQMAFSYDARGMQTETRVSSGATVYSVTQFTYDADGRLACTAVRMNLLSIPATGGSGCAQGTPGSFGPDRITRSLYDVADQLLQTRRAVATGALEQAYVTYTYTLNGDPEDVIDAVGNRAQFAYDLYGRKQQWRFPFATKPAAFNPSTPATAVATAGAVNAADYEQWTYDANENVTVNRKRDGREVVLVYDNLDRRQTRHYRTAGVDELAANWVFYSYDLRGLQTSAAFGSMSGPGIVTEFDRAGRLTSSTDTTGGASRKLAYLHDAASNRIRVTHPDNPAVNYFTYDYDALNRVTAIRESGATALVTIAYDASGDRETLARANGAATAYDHDSVSRLTGLTHDLAGAAQDVTLSLVNGYNPASQIVTRTRANDLYAYLPAAAANQTYVPNGLNQYSSVAGATLAYDANGNLTSDGASTFEYDVENRLLSATGARTATLSYDPAGRLYKTQGASSGNATQLLYDGDALVAEYDSAGTLVRRYVHGPRADEPLVWYEGASLAPPARRFLHADHQGTILAVSDQGGGAIGLNRFDPWGIPAHGNIGRFSYTGQIVIPELTVGGNAATAMLHYKARLYSPGLGRFLQTDPIGYDDQMNLYAYVGNSPINATDPRGTDMICFKKKFCIIRADTYDPSRSNKKTRVASAEEEAVALADTEINAADEDENTGFAVRLPGGLLDIQAAKKPKTYTDLNVDRQRITPPPNAVFVLHAHIPGVSQGLVDERRGIGDSDPLRLNMVNFVKDGRRMAVREIVDGRLQFRMLRGDFKSFPEPDSRHMVREQDLLQQNLNEQQLLFMMGKAK